MSALTRKCSPAVRSRPTWPSAAGGGEGPPTQGVREQGDHNRCAATSAAPPSTTKPVTVAEQPGDVHRGPRPDPQGVREGQRCQDGAVQRHFEGVCPVPRRRRPVHRPRDDGRHRHRLRGVRGEAAQTSVLGHPSATATSARLLAISLAEAEGSSAPSRRARQRPQDPQGDGRRRAGRQPRRPRRRARHRRLARLDQPGPLGFPHNIACDPGITQNAYGDRWTDIDDRRSTYRRTAHDVL